MISSYKNRKLNLSKPVQVYRNLTKKCWSLRQDRLVVAHCSEALLKECKFTVIKKYQERVRQTKRKNVHAWLEGFLHPEPRGTFDFTHRVTYNPYKQDFFEKSPLILAVKPEKIYNCDLALLSNEGTVFIL